MLYLHDAAKIKELRVPPGNRLEALKGYYKGKRGITAESALDLADALGTSAKTWMNLQATFDLDQAMKRREVATRHRSRRM